MRAAVVLIGLVTGLAVNGTAQLPAVEPGPDRWLGAEVRIDQYAPGGRGVEVGLSAGQRWSRYAVSVGASRTSVGQAAFSVGTARVYAAVTDRFSVKAEVGGGPASQSGSDFFYRRAGLGGAMAVWAGRVWADVELTTFSSAAIHGQVLQAGTIAVVNQQLITRAFYGRTLAGTLDTEYVSLRADQSVGVVRLLAGGTLGSALVHPADQRLPVGSARDQVQWFAGITFPAGRHESTVVLEHLADAVIRRYTVSAGLRWRLP